LLSKIDSVLTMQNMQVTGNLLDWPSDTEIQQYECDRWHINKPGSNETCQLADYFGNYAPYIKYEQIKSDILNYLERNKEFITINSHFKLRDKAETFLTYALKAKRISRDTYSLNGGFYPNSNLVEYLLQQGADMTITYQIPWDGGAQISLIAYFIHCIQSDGQFLHRVETGHTAYYYHTLKALTLLINHPQATQENKKEALGIFSLEDPSFLLAYTDAQRLLMESRKEDMYEMVPLNFFEKTKQFLNRRKNKKASKLLMQKKKEWLTIQDYVQNAQKILDQKKEELPKLLRQQQAFCDIEIHLANNL